MYNPGSQPGETPRNDQPSSTPPPPSNYTPPPAGQPQQYGAPPPSQPYNYPPVPQPPPAPKKRSPLLIIIGAIVLAAIICVVAIFLLVGGIFTLTQPVVDAGDAYMTALRDANYNTAFDLSSSALQNEVNNASGLEDALSAKKPSTWSFSSRSINGDTGHLSGTATYSDGKVGTVELSLVKQNGAWKVDGVRLN